MRIPPRLLAWPAAATIRLLRATCRIRLHNDPRPALRTAAEPYAYAVLHAHQLATAIGGEPGTAAMVSRSADGEIMVAILRALGLKAIRGSSARGTRNKGGRSALAELSSYVGNGRPAYLAVDGPRGPRNHVRKGIAALSQQTGAVVLNVVAIPSRRWIIRRAWDRIQIPLPFCRIDAYFAEPLRPQAGEAVEQYRRRIETSLNQLEAARDPAEAISR